MIFSVGANSKRLDTMEQVEQGAAREFTNKNNVKSAENIADLEKRLELLQNEVKSVKAELSDDQLKLKRVSDLITAYEKIVDGIIFIILLGRRGNRRKQLITEINITVLL